jgi:F420-0:gamma-glutamyl ligase
MFVQPIKTRVMLPPQDDLWEAVDESIQEIKEKSIVVVSSKVVAIHQGRCVKMISKEQRDELAIKEADWYVPRRISPEEYIMYTIKERTLVASAGIDGSNANGYWILWPNELEKMTKKIYDWLRVTYQVREVGVVIVDSHSVPLRRGVIGVAMAHFGFDPLVDYRGQKDIFGKELRFATVSIPDVVAVAAVYKMGEAEEQTPLAIISDMDGLTFSDDEIISAGALSIKLSKEEDMYKPMLAGLPWEKGGGGITVEELEKIKKEVEIV